MKKHHWYWIVGFVLFLLLPVYASLHGAGIGVMVAGLIDYLWESFAKKG